MTIIVKNLHHLVFGLKNIRFISSVSHQNPILYAGSQPKGSQQSLGNDMNGALSDSFKLVKNTDAVPTKHLVLMLSWMNANPKDVMKYASIFLNQKCDVLIVPLSVIKIVWPVSGIQTVAKNVGAFLTGAGQYERLLVYGFSGGIMTWGQLLDEMMQDKTRYAPIVDKVVGQVWDSIIIMDMKTLLHAFSIAALPKSAIRRKLFKIYLQVQTAIFQRNTISVYTQGFKQVRENPLIRCPALIFGSSNDLIWSYDCVQDTIDGWKKQNIEVDVKLWDDSRHVEHFRKHKEEYLDVLTKYLLKIQFPSKTE